jgi:hypothetical protein
MRACLVTGQIFPTPRHNSSCDEQNQHVQTCQSMNRKDLTATSDSFCIKQMVLWLPQVVTWQTLAGNHALETNRVSHIRVLISRHGTTRRSGFLKYNTQNKDQRARHAADASTMTREAWHRRNTTTRSGWERGVRFSRSSSRLHDECFDHLAMRFSYSVNCWSQCRQCPE